MIDILITRGRGDLTLNPDLLLRHPWSDSKSRRGMTYVWMKKKTEGGKVWIWWYIGTKRHHRTMDFFFALTNTNICLSVNYKQLKSASSAQEDFSFYHHISTQSPCKKKKKKKTPPHHFKEGKVRFLERLKIFLDVNESIFFFTQRPVDLTSHWIWTSQQSRDFHCTFDFREEIGTTEWSTTFSLIVCLGQS